MPSYLQRVVASGARTTAPARPPVTIAPPVPIVTPAAAGDDAPSDGQWRAEVDVAGRPREDALPVAPPSEPMAPAADATALMRRARALAGAADAVVIRAPRGLRPADVPLLPALDPLASPVMPAPSRPSAAVIARSPAGGVAPRSHAAIATPTRVRAPEDDATGALDARPASTSVRANADPSAREVARGAASARAAAPTPIAASSSAGESRDPSAPAPRPARPHAEIIPAPRPSRAPVTAPGATSRITIGRVEVEVHNEAPSPPPAQPVRAEPPAAPPRLATRFLLRP